MTARRQPVALTPAPHRRVLHTRIVSRALGKVEVSLTIMLGRREWHLGTSSEFSAEDHATILTPLLEGLARGAGLELHIARDTASEGLAFHVDRAIAAERKRRAENRSAATPST